MITTWHDRRIGAGEEFGKRIDEHVNTDEIILLLVSPDFINSDYCYDIEMTRAMERHEAGEAIVIPVILRPCDWHGTPFGKLNATPPDGIAITQQTNLDQAMLEVAKAVRKAAERLQARAPATTAVSRPTGKAPPPTEGSFTASGPRSSNLALARRSQIAIATPLNASRSTIWRGSFRILWTSFAKRNTGIDGDFQRIDANRFTAAIYKGGQTIARCTIVIGDRSFASGIAYSINDAAASNSFNELLTVGSDDQSLYLTSMGMQSMGGQRDQKLT